MLRGWHASAVGQASAAATAMPGLLHQRVHCQAGQLPSPRANGGNGGGRRGSGAGRGRQAGGPGGRSGGRGGGSGRPCDTRQGPANKQQVSFSGRFPEDPVTAIIGGGLSGLACAHELAQRGLKSVVFDTGEHGVGGRLGTRSAADGSLKGAQPASGMLFDHAAQYFTSSDPFFQAMVDHWEREGVVQRWKGPVGSLHDGEFNPDSSQVRYVAKGGMRALAQYLAGQASAALRANNDGGSSRSPLDGLVEVRRPQWVSTARHTEDGWQLVGRGREQGFFDVVVIAHNGKCANRLAEPMGSPGIYSQLRRLKLSANWVLMAAFTRPVPVPGELEGAFIQGSPVLSWAANNSAKLGLAGGLECWTLISTQDYGKQNKVPQENVPPEVAQRVTGEMLAAFERSLGLAPGSLPPVAFTKTQLWGAALPINSPRVPCLYDPVGRVGVCGDWVAEGGSMQAAVLSGRAMAERIDASRGRQPTDIADLALGLTTQLKSVDGEHIGQFPAAGKPAGAPPAATVAAAGLQQQQQQRGQRPPTQQQQRGQRPPTQQQQQQQRKAGRQQQPAAPAPVGAACGPGRNGARAAAGASSGPSAGAGAPQLLRPPVRPAA